MEEEHHRARKLLEIAAEEVAETEGFSQKPKVDMVDLSILKRAYKNKTREIQSFPFGFESDVYKVQPSEGTIWPDSFVEITVNFKPLTSGQFDTTLYCQVQGRETRLPLELKGLALGPKAKLSYTFLNMDSVFIDTRHVYHVVLENEGNIPSKFNLLDNQSLFGPKFTFTPNQGVLQVGEQKVIEVAFESDVLGQFKEEFTFELEV